MGKKKKAVKSLPHRERAKAFWAKQRARQAKRLVKSITPIIAQNGWGKSVEETAIAVADFIVVRFKQR